MASIYFKKPVTFADVELRLRLPVDETSFELGVHSTLPGMFPSCYHIVPVRLHFSMLPRGNGIPSRAYCFPRF